MPTSLFKLAFAGLAVCAAASAPAAPEYPTTHTFGVPFSKDEAWYRQCMRVEHAVAPAARAPAPGATCDASRLYYEKRSQAVTSPAEWRTVRACALARGDNAVLMMLYANGFGVPRDLDIAIHYACSLDFASKAETEGRITHLAGGLPAGALFDQCDDITSGAMEGVCAEIRQTQAQRVRAARLDRAARAMPASALPAFKALRAAAAAYAGAAPAEVDAHGSAAAAFATEHQWKLDEQFMRAVLDVLDGKLPAATPTEAKRLDGELNAVYQDLVNTPSKQKDEPGRIGDSTVERGDVRKVERLWLAYRDAFLALRGTLPSGSDRDAIEALLLRQRIATLNTIAQYR